VESTQALCVVTVLNLHHPLDCWSDDETDTNPKRERGILRSLASLAFRVGMKSTCRYHTAADMEIPRFKG
jgi:hypothetical protein